MSDKPQYDLKGGKPHPFYLVRPSIWPMVNAFAGGFLALCAIVFMHAGEGFKFGTPVLVAGFVTVISAMALWWRDVIREAVGEKAYTNEVTVGMRYGMLLFIASEIMFFFAFFWAFFNASVITVSSLGHVFPAETIDTIPAFDLPFLMTMILLLSGCTCTWAHHAILEGKQDDASKALLITVGLGIVFSLFQAYEYAHATFGFKETVYSSVFYMLTGFHGFHVLVGTAFLAVCYFRNRKGHFTPQSHYGFEAAAWYWHFVDAVWLVVFVWIYWWGGA